MWGQLPCGTTVSFKNSQHKNLGQNNVIYTIDKIRKQKFLSTSVMSFLAAATYREFHITAILKINNWNKAHMLGNCVGERM